MKTTDQRAAVIERESELRWTAHCENPDCIWTVQAYDRDAAVDAGREHVAAIHGGDEEWSFRVLGVRPSRPKPRIAFAPLHRRSEKERMMRTPHAFVDAGLTPTGCERGCALCGFYEAFHDDCIPVTW